MGDYDDDYNDDYDDEEEEEEVFEEGDYDDETYSAPRKVVEEEEEDEDEEVVEDEEVIEVEEKYTISDLPIVSNGDINYVVIGKEEIEKYGIEKIKRISNPILLNFVATEITYPFLTRYESATLIIERATEMSKGKLSTIEKEVDLKGKEIIEIAEMELQLGKIPLFVIRPRDNDSSKVFNINKAFLIDPNGYNAYGKRIFDGSYT